MTDRHEKWVKVEPGTVIPAGQPFAIADPEGCRKWAEFVYTTDTRVSHDSITVTEWFVDSSWKPPLVLPTEPTWGIAASRWDTRIGRWYVEGTLLRDKRGGWMNAADVLDFIPLTDEQVQRIEAAR